MKKILSILCAFVLGFTVMAQSGQAPSQVTVSGPSRLLAGTPATYTVSYVSADPVTVIRWSMPHGTPASLSGLDESVEVTYSNPGTYYINCVVANANGSSNAYIPVEVYSYDWGDEMDYSNGGEYLNNTWGDKWGVKYPAALLAGRNYVTKVSAYIENQYADGPYNLSLYQGGENEPGTEIYNHWYWITTTGDWVDFLIPYGLAIDPTQDLWVVLEFGYSSPQVANYTDYCGDPNSCWKYDNNTEEWRYLFDITNNYYGTWMLKTTTSDAAPAFDFDIEGLANVAVGVEATFTLDGPADATYSWTFEEGNPATASGTTASTIWNTPGTYTVTVNAIRGSLIVSQTKTVTVHSCDVTGLPWEENFNVGLGCWTTLDADGDGHGWFAYFDEYNDDDFGYAVSESFYDDGEGDYALLDPDNWLISPQIPLPSVGSISVAWRDIGAYSGDPEHYGLYVSTTGTDIEDFTLLWEGSGSDPYTTRSLIQSLDAYGGQNIYLAFRHFNSSNNDNRLMITNVQVGTSFFTVAASSNLPNMARVGGSGIYLEGQAATLTAEIWNDCYEFSHWEVNGIYYSNESTIEVTSDANAVAYFRNKYSSYTEVTSCGPYYWDKTDKTYNKSGMKTFKSTSETDGCPIRDTLVLTIVDHYGSYTEVSNCGPYTWRVNGKTYNKGGRKVYNGTAPDGCPIRDTLALTIVDKWSSYTRVTSCGPYTWDLTNQTYNKSGMKYRKMTADDGCPIRDTLELTVVDHYGTNTVVTNCGPYTWAVNGRTYNKGGVKTNTGRSDDGCPIRDTLTLTVNPIHANHEVVRNCGPYTWEVNGKTYNKSGVKTNKGTTPEGCPAYDTLTLTVLNSPVGHTEVTSCGPYTWATNGKTYNKGGVKTYKGTTPEDCPIRDTLILTVVDKWVSYTYDTNCGPYTWSVTGKTYNKGGIKTYKGTAADGCPKYDTLNLTIVDRWTSHEYVTNCGPYLWDVNGRTYNKGGIKTNKGVAPDGCPTYDTLELTVVDRWTNHEYVTNCGPYTWPVNGTTYNKSGVKTYKGVAADGCPTYDTLTLTINNCDKNPETNSQLSTLNSQLSIYPNPTTGLVHIDAVAVERVEVLDLVGRCVTVFKETNTLDLTGLAAGTYTLRITMPDGVFTRRVIKK